MELLLDGRSGQPIDCHRTADIKLLSSKKFAKKRKNPFRFASKGVLCTQGRSLTLCILCFLFFVSISCKYPI